VFGHLHFVLREEAGSVRDEEFRIGEVHVPLDRACTIEDG